MKLNNTAIAYQDAKKIFDGAIDLDGLKVRMASPANAVYMVQRLNQWRKAYREERGQMTAYDEFVVRRADEFIILEKRIKRLGPEIEFMTLDDQPVEDIGKHAANTELRRMAQRKTEEIMAKARKGEPIENWNALPEAPPITRLDED